MYLYHRDDLGSVVSVHDAMGQVIEGHTYGDFGEPLSVSTIGNPYLFTGSRYDEESGWYYKRTRYYDANVGQFTTRDSIGVWGDSSNLGNARAYVGNGPQTFVDPTGRIFETLWDAAWAVYDTGVAIKNTAEVGYEATRWAFGKATGNEELAANAAAGLKSDAKELGWAVAGVTADLGAILAPGVPTPGSAGIKAAVVGVVVRGADDVVDAAKTADKSSGAAKVVEISRSKYPEGAQHVDDAIKSGQPSTLTIDRPGARSNRSAATKGKSKTPGKDNDEYPPAMFVEGGSGSSVRPMTPSHNRGMGSSVGNQCRGLPNGAKVEIKVVD